MSAKRSGKLRVEGSGVGHCIRVPSNRAEALHAYLLTRRVLASPPQPCTADVDSIHLGKGMDLAAVQALLDKWS